MAPPRWAAYTRRRLSGAHATCDSRPGVSVTRSASPPSFAPAANTSPRTTSATFLPSGDSASSWKSSVKRRRSGSGAAGVPRSVTGTSAASPVAVSIRQMRKSRSNTSVRPSGEAEGQSTRPPRKRVTWRGAAPGATLHTFCAPPRSETKKSVRPSGPHMGHPSRAPRRVTCS